MQNAFQTPRAVQRVSGLAFGLLLAGCGADGILGARLDAESRTVSVPVGRQIDVTLRNVGPAQYLSPPVISSDAVTFVSVDVVPPFNPGGPTQRFRLRASAVGTAVVVFQRAMGDSIVSVVEDTIRVR